MPTKIVLDTDIGSNMDDAICLAYLLVNPACDLRGITTVSGDTVKRAQLASVLCRAAGRSIPIHPGRQQPLLIEQRQKEVPEAAILERWDHERDFSRGEAIEFLRQTIRAHPGEIVLLGIGPMTNLAALFGADEEIPSLLKGLVLMCGRFDLPPKAEWNALLDPVATAIVYRAKPPRHRSVGLDVTCQVAMPKEEVRKRFQSPALRPVLDFAEIGFKRGKEAGFHDPVAAATIFDEQICTFGRGQIEVELKGKRLAGLTRWTPLAEGATEIAMSVDPKRFFDHYFSFFP